MVRELRARASEEYLKMKCAQQSVDKTWGRGNHNLCILCCNGGPNWDQRLKLQRGRCCHLRSVHCHDLFWPAMNWHLLHSSLCSCPLQSWSRRQTTAVRDSGDNFCKVTPWKSSLQVPLRNLKCHYSLRCRPLRFYSLSALSLPRHPAQVFPFFNLPFHPFRVSGPQSLTDKWIWFWADQYITPFSENKQND